MAGVKIVDKLADGDRCAFVLRHVGQETPGRVTWSVIFAGPSVALVDSVASGLGTLGLARRLACGFVAGGAL